MRQQRRRAELSLQMEGSQQQQGLQFHLLPHALSASYFGGDDGDVLTELLRMSLNGAKKEETQTQQIMLVICVISLSMNYEDGYQRNYMRGAP